MNNVDVSIINVLKASNPEIFGLYFSVMGTTPNPNQKVRREARKLFQMHSSESFDSFMQRYRNWINDPRDRNLDQFNVSTQTDPELPQSNADLNTTPSQRTEEDETEIPDILEIRSLFIDPSQKEEEPEFEVLPFLRKKSLYRDYTYLDFQLNEDWINSVNEVSDLDNMSPLLKMLNAIHNYKVLELNEVNIQRKVEEWNPD